MVIPYASAHVFLIFEAMSLNRDTVSSEQLGHLGLVAATIRELGIIEKIDARLALNERKGGLVTYGRRVAAGTEWPWFYEQPPFNDHPFFSRQTCCTIIKR